MMAASTGCSGEAPSDSAGNVTQAAAKPSPKDHVCLTESQLGKVCGERQKVANLLLSWNREDKVRAASAGKEALVNTHTAQMMCAVRNLSVAGGATISFYLAANGVFYLLGGLLEEDTAVALFHALPDVLRNLRWGVMKGFIEEDGLSFTNWATRVLPRTHATRAGEIAGLAGVSAATSAAWTWVGTITGNEQLTCMFK